jgi:hypothetical protein
MSGGGGARVLNSEYFTLLDRSVQGEFEYQAYRVVHPASTILLFSTVSGSDAQPIAALSVLPKSTGGNAKMVVTRRNAAPHLPAAAVEHGYASSFFQALSNVDNDEFQFVISNLTDFVSRPDIDPLVATNRTSVGYVKIDILGHPIDVRETDYPTIGVNQINELRPSESYAIKSDQRTGNKTMVLRGAVDKQTGAAVSVAQDEAKGTVNEKTQASYFFVSVVASTRFPDLVAMLAQTTWRATDVFVRRIPKNNGVSRPRGPFSFGGSSLQTYGSFVSTDGFSDDDDDDDDDSSDEFDNIPLSYQPRRQQQPEQRFLFSTPNANTFAATSVSRGDRYDGSLDHIYRNNNRSRGRDTRDGRGNDRSNDRNNDRRISQLAKGRQTRNAEVRNVERMLDRAERTERGANQITLLSTNTVVRNARNSNSRQPANIERMLALEREQHEKGIYVFGPATDDDNTDMAIDQQDALLEDALLVGAAPSQQAVQMSQAGEVLQGSNTVRVVSGQTGVTYNYDVRAERFCLGMSVWRDMPLLATLTDDEAKQEATMQLQEAREGTNKALLASLKSVYKQDECVICMAAEPTQIFLQCGHQCVCAACSNDSEVQKNALCYLCRGKIVARIFG